MPASKWKLAAMGRSCGQAGPGTRRSVPARSAAARGRRAGSRLLGDEEAEAEIA